jgi:predicted PurR-regulated permease PerM
MVPLSDEEATRMFRRIEDTILATVNGSLTSLHPSLLAGIMYTALGVPASVIWAATTFIAALLPVFGTVLVWGPISLFCCSVAVGSRL